MTAPSDVKIDMDKPPPYAPYYDSTQQGGQPGGYPPQQYGYPPPSQGYPPQSQGYPPPHSHGHPQPQNYNPSYPSPPPAGFVVPTSQSQHPPPAPHVIVVQQGPVVTGNCPVCRIGNLHEDYTCCGICCAIFFFPLGLICCLLMKEKRCSHCGACQ